MGSVQDHAVADLKKRGEISDRIVTSAGQEKSGERREKTLAAEEKQQAGGPAEKNQRRRQVHAQQKNPVQFGLPAQMR